MKEKIEKYTQILKIELEDLEKDLLMMAEIYHQRELKGEITDYVFLENLSPNIAVHRLAAVASRWDELVAPQWTREKMKTTQFIDDFLAAKETWQGRCFEV